MKKVLAVGLMCFSMMAANAQKLNEADVPVIIKNAFVKMYPGIKEAQWNKEGNLYKASFVEENYRGSVSFNENGKWTERETAIPVKSLPVIIKNYIEVNYKNRRITAAAKITKAFGEMQYKATIEGKNILFTKDGSFIKDIK